MYWMKKMEMHFAANIDSEHRIVQFFYGKYGYLSFLENLFGPLHKKNKTAAFNYYFSLKTIV